MPCHCRVPAGHHCDTGWHPGTKWGTRTSLCIPPPCSFVGCSPSLPYTSPAAGYNGAPVDQSFWVAGKWLAWFKARCVGRMYNYLKWIWSVQHLDIFSRKDDSKIYTLTCYLSNLCLKNIHGVITGKWKVMLKGILLFGQQHQISYKCWFLGWFCS